MNSFRGTLISAGFAAVLGIGWYVQQPQSKAPKANEQLFQFEKHELVKVEINRPESQSLVLEELDGQWKISGTEFDVSKSMVNRIKHQLHDLTARTLVEENPADPSRFGLGVKGIHVRLTMRNGKTIAFVAGDPNPTGVSYYIQPDSSNAVYTVKKSALDYYSLEISSFRESRFAYFDAKEVQSIRVVQPSGEDFALSLTPEERWLLIEPFEMAADSDMVRRLMGRIAALKARRFVEKGEPDYPLAIIEEVPRLRVLLTEKSGSTLEVSFFGHEVENGEGLCWVKLKNESSLYLVPEKTLEAFDIELDTLKDRKVFPLLAEDIQALTVSSGPGEGSIPEGTYSAQQLSGVWTWQDGVPVPGSTPDRLANALSGIRVIEFLDGERSAFQLDASNAPLHIQADSQNTSVNVYLGAEGEPLIDDEGNAFKRYTMAIDEHPEVYLVDVHLRSVGHDFVREGGRRNDRALEQAERRERLGIEGEDQ